MSPLPAMLIPLFENAQPDFLVCFLVQIVPVLRQLVSFLWEMLPLNLLHPLCRQHHVVELLVELPPATLLVIPTLLPDFILRVPDRVAVLFDRDVVVSPNAPEAHHSDFHVTLAASVVVPANPRLRNF